MRKMTNNKLLEQRENISNEDDLQRYLEAGMEHSGWMVLREVSPRGASYKADIVAKHDDIGWVGIECKYVTGGPVVAAKASRQIFDKYADQKYLNNKITAWGICLYGRDYSAATPDKDDFEREEWYHDRRASKSTCVATTKRIVNGFGLGYVTADEDRVLMEFLPGEPSVKVPLFKLDGDIHERFYEEINMDRIETLASERRP